MEFASAGVSGVRFMAAVCYEGVAKLVHCTYLLRGAQLCTPGLGNPLGGWYQTVYPWVG